MCIKQPYLVNTLNSNIKNSRCNKMVLSDLESVKNSKKKSVKYFKKADPLFWYKFLCFDILLKKYELPNHKQKPEQVWLYDHLY